MKQSMNPIDFFTIHKDWSNSLKVYTSTTEVIRNVKTFVRLCSGNGFTFVCDRREWKAANGRVTEL
jgi:hypothetical protein